MQRSELITTVLVISSAFIVAGCGDNLPEGLSERHETVQSRTGGQNPQELIKSIQNDPNLPEANKQMRIDTIKKRNHIQ